MPVGVAVILTALAGALVTMQAPINSGLGKAVGTFAAATVSFAIGTVLLAGVTLVAGGARFSNLDKALDLPWHYLLGGVLGAVYVTTILVAVRELGAGGVTAATIAGQLTMAIALDRAGVLGLPQKAITGERLAGVALLAVGVFLIVRR